MHPAARLLLAFAMLPQRSWFGKVRGTLGWALVISGTMVFLLVLFQPWQTASQVKPGMSLSAAIDAVGRQAGWSQSTAEYCDTPRWNWACEEAMKSGAVNVLIWKIGIDTVLIVGVNAQSTVVFRSVGDT